MFSEYTEAHIVKANLNTEYSYYVPEKIFEHIILSGVMAIIVFLLFRKWG